MVFQEICLCFDKRIRFSTKACADQTHFSERAIRTAKNRLINIGYVSQKGSNRDSDTFPLAGWQEKARGDWVPDNGLIDYEDHTRTAAPRAGKPDEKAAPHAGKGGITCRKPLNAKICKSLENMIAAPQKAAGDAVLRKEHETSATAGQLQNEPSDKEWADRTGLSPFRADR